MSGDSSQDEAEDDAKPVTVKYARPESEAAKARRLGSYAYLHKKHEGEAWVPLSYHNIHVSICSMQGQSEASKARRLGSFAYLHKKHEGEAWVPLSYHNIHVSLCSTQGQNLRLLKLGGWVPTHIYIRNMKARPGYH